MILLLIFSERTVAADQQENQGDEAAVDIDDPFNDDDYLAASSDSDNSTSRSAADKEPREDDDEEQDENEEAVSNKLPPLPSRKQQKRVLGYALTESSNDDLYSTDEERPQRFHQPSSSHESSVLNNSTLIPSIHCDKCTGAHKIPYIEYEISADGVQLHKRAVKCAAWPLMGQIIFLSPCIHLKDKIRFYMPRNCAPVIIGFYYGTTKSTSPNQFLKCVFKEMRLAKKRGLCDMFIKFYIGDGPSRQFIKGFPSHGAYCGCERCCERGVCIEKTTLNKKTGRPNKGHVCIVKTRNLKLRTAANYLDNRCYGRVRPQRDNILHKYSKETNGAFHILHSVPIDPMHTVFHCAITWIFEGAWFSGKNIKGGKFPPKLMASLETKLQTVKGCLPYAIGASGVGTKRLEKFGTTWSCAEKRVFLLYVSIVIMRDSLMEPEAYKILLSLHHAIMLLSGSRHMSPVPEQHLRKAQQHLLYVVEKCQRLYGVDFPRYTVHAMLHLVDDLRHNQCRLDYSSMFKYENSMKFFVHVLDKRAGARVHAQIRNSLIRRKLSNVVLPPQ